MIHHAEQSNPLKCKWSQAEAPVTAAALVAMGRRSGAGGSRVLVSAVTARQCGQGRYFSEPGHDSTRIPVTTAQLYGLLQIIMGEMASTFIFRSKQRCFERTRRFLSLFFWIVKYIHQIDDASNLVYMHLLYQLLFLIYVDVCVGDVCICILLSQWNWCHTESKFMKKFTT